VSETLGAMDPQLESSLAVLTVGPSVLTIGPSVTTIRLRSTSHTVVVTPDF